MRITIDHARCIGSGNCVLAAPSVFAQDDEDGTVILLTGTPDDGLAGAVGEAAETCPARVITVER